MKSITFGADNRSDNLLHIEVPGAIINIRVNLHGPDSRTVTAVDILPEDESRSPDLDGYYWRLAGDGRRVIRDPRPGMTSVPPDEMTRECRYCGTDIEQADVGGDWYDVTTAQDEDGTGVASLASVTCDQAPESSDAPGDGQHYPVEGRV